MKPASGSAQRAVQQATALLDRGDRDGALRVCRDILGRFPGNAAARAIEAKILAAERGDEQQAMALLHALLVGGQAEEVLRRAPELLARHPGSADLHNLLGATLAGLGRLDDAVNAYDMATRLDPDRASFASNRGVTLRDLGRHAEALASFDRALERDPAYAAAHYNRANVLKHLRRLPEALAGYDRAIDCRADYADAWNNRAVALLDLARPADALASADRAIALAPQLADAAYNRALALAMLRRLDEAATAHGAALALRPDFARAQVGKLQVESAVCDWATRDAELATGPTGLAGETVDPFPLLALEDRPDHHFIRGSRWVAANWGKVERARIPARAAPNRLRIGYFSADFHDHATMHLMARLFALHDRSRFEVHAFSFGPADDGPLRQAAVAAMDGFHDVRALDDAAIATLARAHAIDIAVDLKGHTRDARTGIFAHGAAPVQTAYLGYPGTTGAPFIDYLIADDIVVPAATRHLHSERIVYLPDTYLATDNSRLVGDAGARAAHGLPESGFVFCSFNNSYKISATEFDSWMRMLGAVDGSVLWLLLDNVWAAANLRAEAAQRGIAPERLVFAPRVASAEHLARHKLADLCLDSFNCNAHTTAVDCLWAGVPIVTTPGRSFAARVATSLLRAIEMPELIAADRAEYERRAIALASDPATLGDLRARLAANRTTTALFDTERLTRHLETAYTLMHAAHRDGDTGDLRVLPA